MKLTPSPKRALEVVRQDNGLKRLFDQRIYFVAIDGGFVYFRHATVLALIRAGLATETRRPTSRIFVAQCIEGGVS